MLRIKCVLLHSRPILHFLDKFKCTNLFLNNKLVLRPTDPGVREGRTDRGGEKEVSRVVGERSKSSSRRVSREGICET